MKRFQQVSVTLCFAILSAVNVGVVTADVEVAVGAQEDDLERLGPDQGSSAVSFCVENAVTSIMVRILAPTDALVTSITGPNGELIDPSTVEQFGGGFAFSQDPGSTGGLLITQLDHYFDRYDYELPSLGPGVYEVGFELDPPPADDIPIVVEVSFDSSLRSALFVTEWILPVSQTGVACLALFDGANPVAGADVVLSITAPDGETLEGLPLVDDGGDADGMAGDGLYSAAFPVDQVGEYLLAARATVGSDVRTSGASVLVVEPGASLGETAIASELVDTNGNGLAEFLALNLPVDVQMPSTYVAVVLLSTPSGEVLNAYGTSELGPGPGIIPAILDAATVRATGEDGPYRITSVSLRRDSDDGMLPSDRVQGLDAETIPFVQDQFERPAVFLTGANTDVATDTDSDGDFDLLSIAIGIEVTLPGTYQFSGRLVDSCGGEIEFVFGEQELFGVSGEVIETQFDGMLIGANGIDGPYAVQDFLVFGTAGSVVATMAAQSQMFDAATFDAYVAPEDCNRNGNPDRCDIFFGTSTDEDANGIPDECEGGNCPWDLNGDGVVNIYDLLELFLQWGPCEGCPADFNGNGWVGLFDLIELILHLGPCE